jgi:hypothetical protein
MTISRFCLSVLLFGMTHPLLAADTPPTDVEVEDFFTMSKGEAQYICERIIPFDPMGALKCRTLAYKGPFTTQQVETLCERSINEAPVLCANQARNSFTTADSIGLCQHAKNSGPAECAERAYRWPFFKSEIITLCKGSGTINNAECALAAYNGHYSKAEAINICKNNQ